ncbi:MAG: YCF48-related protein [Ignavibacteriaceae bacterium]|nr:YCF48-related protein [Ignavibacteriaceae bacterium]
MRTLIFFFFAVCFSVTIHGQWNYIPTTNLIPRLKTISPVSEEIVWALAERGTIVRSTDGGVTWSIQKPDIPTNLNGMAFTNEMNGYLTGNDGYLYRTTDGGLTWSSQIPFPGLRLTAIQFLNPFVGYILVPNSAILKTSDGGSTWTHIPAVSATPYRSMAFYNDQIGMIAYGVGYTARTTDGGATWLTASTGFDSYNEYIRDIQWLSAGKALAIDNNGHLFVTIDTGRTWQQKIISSEFKPYSMHFQDALNGVIADRVSKLVRTSDAGQTFEVMPSPESGNYPEDIFMYDTSRIYIAGPKHFVYRTTNGGVVWSGIHTQEELQLNAVNLRSSTSAMVVGSSGLLGLGALDGSSFSPRETRTRKDLFAVAHSNTSKGIAAGEDGVIVYSNSALMEIWSVTNTGFPNDIYAITVNPGSDKVFAAGEGGIILRSQDFGLTWEQMNSGVSTRINAIKIFDGINLIAVGDSGLVLRSTDDGVTWNEIFVSTTKKLLSLTGLGPNRLITGESGLVLRSSNSGDVWHRVVIMDTVNITGVTSYTQNSSRLVTSSGVVYATTNSGQSWSRELINPAISFKSVSAQSWSAMGVLFDKMGFLGFKASVPVELTSFTASVSENNITLNWSTATETNNRGFEIQRSSDNETWLPIGFKQGGGTSAEPNIYSFADQNPLSGVNYYRLKQIDYDGTEEVFESVSAEFIVAADFSLEQNYPNPFNPATTIAYSLPVSGLVQLKVYNTTGEEVAALVNQLQDAGSYQIRFNAAGLASGTYLYRITVTSDAGVYTQSRKMIILK